MVRRKSDAQFYTMEGIAAGFIMLLTLYLVLGSTMIYSPGDTRIPDMRLKQEGSDILRVMNTPRSLTGPPESLQPTQSDLEQILITGSPSINRWEEINQTFRRYLNFTVAPTTLAVSAINIDVNVSYIDTGGRVRSQNFAVFTAQNAAPMSQTPRVLATTWVYTASSNQALYPGQTAGVQPMLVEVFVWKA